MLMFWKWDSKYKRIKYGQILWISQLINAELKFDWSCVIVLLKCYDSRLFIVGGEFIQIFDNNNNISKSKPLSWKVGFYVELWILNSFNNFWLNSFHWVEKQSCWERIKFFPQLSPVSGLSKLDLHWDIECCVEYSHDCKLLAVFSILLLSDQPDQHQLWVSAEWQSSFMQALSRQ